MTTKNIALRLHHCISPSTQFSFMGAASTVRSTGSNALMVQMQQQQQHIMQKYYHRSMTMMQEKENEERQETETEAEQETENKDQEQEQQPPKDEKDTKIAEMEEKLKELDSKYKHALADMENTRRIARLDVDKAKKYSIGNFAKSLLEVADNMERALNVMDVEQIKEDETLEPKLKKKLITVMQGVKMTHGIFHKVLAGNDITKIPDPKGEKFDPRFHEAMMRQTDPDTPNGTVFHVISNGYMINDRILRPTQVAVVVGDMDEDLDTGEDESSQGEGNNGEEQQRQQEQKNE